MREDYSDRYEYPKRGRYGDTAQRCAWCGKNTSWLERHFFAGSFRRNYCSFSCRAAGDLYIDAVVLVVALILMQLPISWILSLSNADVPLLIGWLFVITSPFFLCIVSSIAIGYRERCRERTASK